MREKTPSPGPAPAHAERVPLLSYNPVFIGLRYLWRKKLSYLAVVGVALSVGTLIVVMSVFSGFHRQLTGVIRGYLSDMRIEPAAGELYGLEDWRTWRRQLLETPHVTGAAPFIEGAGLLRMPGSGRMSHIFFRGVHPELEGTVSELPEYMEVGRLQDLGKRYRDPQSPGGKLRACFVGETFFGYVPPQIQRRPRPLVLVTATPDLRRRIRKFAVNGIFRTGNYDYDSNVVILSLQTAMDFVDADAVSGLNVKLDDYNNAERARRLLQQRLAPGAVLKQFTLDGGAPRTVALSPDGRRVAAAFPDRPIRIWSASGDTGQRLDTGGRPATALALAEEGGPAAYGTDDGTVGVWMPPGDEIRFRTEPRGTAVTALNFDPDGRLLAVGHADGLLELRDAETGAAAGSPEGHKGEIHDLTFAPDGRRMVSASADGTARVFDVETASAVTLARAGDGGIVAATFSPDGETLLTGTAAGRPAAWDAGTGERLASWPEAVEGLRGLAFGWTSRLVLTAAHDGLRVWYLDRLQDAAVVRPGLRAESAAGLQSAAFGADGHRVATIDSEDRVQLRYMGGGFEVTTWEEQRKTFLEAVAMEQFLQALIMSFILLLAGFLIFAIVTTLVYEKRRDIGILKAIGFTRGQICLVFVTCGLAIGVVGGLLGVAGGVAFAENINAVREFIKQTIQFDPFPPELYYFDKIPAYVGFWAPALTAAGAIFCSLFFSVFPALRAARLDPIEALHHE
ncbi:MAG: FtsX-like permease family protein [Planctomycetota bacterium]